MINNYLNSRKILVLPALASFLIAVILLIKYSYPISWDVYYHVHMSNLYLDNCLIFWDYDTVAPVGRQIMYPPLFHLIIALSSYVTGLSPMEIARLSQPIFSFILIYAITYVTYKLSDTKTALFVGFLSMLSFSVFNRSVISTPATIAIALSMISLLYFYESFNEDSLKKLLLSSILLALIFNLHMATAIITMGVIGLYSLIKLVKKELNIKHIIVYLAILFIVGFSWWIYIYINYGFVFNSLPGNPLRIDEFLIKYFGIIPTAFALIGFYTLVKRFDKKSLFILTWSLSILLLSQVYLIGISTVAIRILEVAAYPLIIVSAIGFSACYDRLSKSSTKNVLVIFLILTAILSASCFTDSYTPNVMDSDDVTTSVIPQSVHLVIDPVGTIYKPSIISDRWANVRLAKDRYDIIRYFNHTDDESIVVSEDSIMDTLIVSTSNHKVIYGGFTESIPEYVVDPVHIIQNYSTKTELDELGIGYILLRKNTTVPSYADNIYENTNYKICKINRIKQ